MILTIRKLGSSHLFATGLLVCKTAGNSKDSISNFRPESTSRPLPSGHSAWLRRTFVQGEHSFPPETLSPKDRRCLSKLCSGAKAAGVPPQWLLSEARSSDPNRTAWRSSLTRSTGSHRHLNYRGSRHVRRNTGASLFLTERSEQMRSIGNEGAEFQGKGKFSFSRKSGPGIRTIWFLSR
jgi:hypothetical protein